MWSKIKAIFCKASEGVVSGIDDHSEDIANDPNWEKRDPSRVYVAIVMESGQGFTPIMTNDSCFLQLSTGEELSFKKLGTAQIYCTEEMGMMRNNTPGHEENSDKTPLAINFLKNRKIVASCTWDELKIKKDRLYDVDNMTQVYQNKEVMAEAIKISWGS